MLVQFEVTEEFAKTFASDAEGLSRAALEAFAADGVRSGKLTVAQAQRMLDIPSRYDMDGFLKAREVFLPLTAEDIERDTEVALRYAE